MKSSEVKRFAALCGFAPVDVGNPEQGTLAEAWASTRGAWPHLPVIGFRGKAIAKVALKGLL